MLACPVGNSRVAEIAKKNNGGVGGLCLWTRANVRKIAVSSLTDDRPNHVMVRFGCTSYLLKTFSGGVPCLIEVPSEAISTLRFRARKSRSAFFVVNHLSPVTMAMGGTITR